MGYLDQFLGSKLNYRGKETQTPFTSQFASQEAQPSQIEQAFSDVQQPQQQPQQPSWMENAMGTAGFNEGLISAGSALMGGKGMSGALDGFQGEIKGAEAEASKQEQQDFQNQMATDKLVLAQEQFGYGQKQDGITNGIAERKTVLDENASPADIAYKKAKAQEALYKANNPTSDNKYSMTPLSVIGEDGKPTGIQVFPSNRGGFIDAQGRPFQVPPGQSLAKDYAPKDRSNKLIFKNPNDNEGVQFDYDPKRREDFAWIDGKEVSYPDYLKENPQAREATSKEIGMDKESLAKLYTHEDKIVEQEKGLKQLASYRNIITETPDGGERYFSRALGNLQTLVGQGNSVSEISKMIKEGDNRAMSLVGLLREDVVGGGVMTEQDALKVLMAMGGDPTNITWNKEVASRMINDLYDQRSTDVRRQTENYNVLREKRGLKAYESSYNLQGKQFNQPKTPKIAVGTVDGEYTFKGGDPTKEENWSK